MEAAVFHGSPRRGNTYFATKIFMDALSGQGDVRYTEFFLPEALPAFCNGCTLCLGGKREACKQASYVTPILDAMLHADALIFATPHYGACDMTGAMKNLLDHLSFLVLNVLPRAEMFEKKAFVITTGAGTAAAIQPIKKMLRHWGLNRVYSLGFRLRTDRWKNMPQARQMKYERALRRSARNFYQTKKGPPYLGTICFYHMSKFILKRYVGPGNYPYDYWEQQGYFKKRPF